VARTVTKAEVLACIHGIDLLWPCLGCEELTLQLTKEDDMSKGESKKQERAEHKGKGGKRGC
jgi:hypothetical protein